MLSLPLIEESVTVCFKCQQYSKAWIPDVRDYNIADVLALGGVTVLGGNKAAPKRTKSQNMFFKNSFGTDPLRDGLRVSHVIVGH